MEEDQEQQVAVEESEDEEGLTAQNVLVAIENAWLNEKFAPEILPHKSDLIECMLQQIAHMESNIKRLDKNDMRLMIHRMELDRIKFVIASYLRTRLEKIERYAIHILSQETKRNLDDCYLSPGEQQFAKDYLASMETLFRTIALRYMPGTFQAFDANRFSVKPNTEAYVFLRANQSVSGIVLSIDEDIDFEAGSQHLIQYSAVADLVKNDAVQLI